MDQTSSRVIEEIRKTEMLKDGDRVIAGVSGGADSVFLFFMFMEAARTMNLTLKVVHVHHGIRGTDADADAAFVEQLCRAHDVPCVVVRRDIPREAAEKGLSLEEAGRNARYEIFRAEAARFVGSTGAVRIALAHHRDDLAETVLFRIARGTGIRGLAAMRPIAGDFIRPLLHLTRREIENSLAERGILWRTDATNAEPDAARNRIRNEILPMLREKVNEGVDEHLARLAEFAADTDDFIRLEASKRAAAYLSGNAARADTQADSAHKFRADMQADSARKFHADAQADSPCSTRVAISAALLDEPAVIRAEILRMALTQMTDASPRDISQLHIKALESLLEKPDGASLDLPRGLRAVRTPDGIELRTGTAPAPAARKSDEIELRIDELSRGPVTADIQGENTDIWHISIGFAAVPPLPLPEKRYTKWIDYDKIKDTLVIRMRKDGDFLTIDAAGHKKTLSDYFTDSKVPRSARGRIPLIADGQEIVWAAGMRLGFRYRISPDTRRALKIHAEKEQTDGAE